MFVVCSLCVRCRFSSTNDGLTEPGYIDQLACEQKKNGSPSMRDEPVQSGYYGIPPGDDIFGPQPAETVRDFCAETTPDWCHTNIEYCTNDRMPQHSWECICMDFESSSGTHSPLETLTLSSINLSFEVKETCLS